MNFLGFGQTAEVEIELNDKETRKQVEVKGEEGNKDKLFLFFDGETVAGKVHINLKQQGKKLEHNGIKVEFVGQIELFYDRGNHHEFVTLVKELSPPGDLSRKCDVPV
eukprot:Opistho-2@46578